MSMSHGGSSASFPKKSRPDPQLLAIAFAAFTLFGCDVHETPTTTDQSRRGAPGSPPTAAVAAWMMDWKADSDRPQIWCDGERFDGLVTPNAKEPGSRRFGELYVAAHPFRQGAMFISNMKPGDRDYRGGWWRVNVAHTGVPADKYIGASRVSDLDLEDFSPTPDFIRCTMQPRRGRGKPGPLHVPDDYASIQDALNAAVDGDEIIVAPGAYSERFVVPPVNLTLRSESGDPHDTIVHGEDSGDAGNPLIRVAAHEGGSRTIEGFTFTRSVGSAIRARLAPTNDRLLLKNCRLVENGPFTPLSVAGGSVDIVSCEFIDNASYILGGAAWLACNVRIVGSLFRNNDALPFGPVTLTQGGAVYLQSGGGPYTAEIHDNVFIENHCTDYGGALQITDDFATTVTNNLFQRNDAGICAGGIYVTVSRTHPVLIENNVFIEEISPQGAAIGIEASRNTVVRSNTIVASDGGEGIRIEGSHAIVISNNIVAHNRTRGIHWTRSSGTMECNNAYGNPAGNYTGINTSDSNLELDPLFCDREAGELTLSADSPCLPENNSCQSLMGARGIGCSFASPSSMRRAGRGTEDGM